MRCASAASTNAPVISSSVARPSPTMRGSSWAQPMSAPARPTFTNRNAIRAVSAATRRSEATAMAAPAPAVVPFSAATMGAGSARMAADEVAGQARELEQPRRVALEQRRR